MKTLFFIIFILLVSISNGPTPSPLEPPKKKESHSGSIEKTSSIPNNIANPAIPKTGTAERITESPVKTPSSPNKNHQQTRTQRDKKSSTNWWLVCFTFVLALVAILQLSSFIYQIISTRNERRVSERAWVNTNFSQEFTPGDEYLAYIISNTGKTPAFVKHIQVYISEQFKGIDIKKRVLDKKKKLTTRMMVFPGEKISRQEPTKNSAFVFSQQKIIIWGVIIYDDVFGDRHTTRFSRTYNKENKLFVIDPDAKDGQNDAT